MRRLLILLLPFFFGTASAQLPHQPSSAEIYQDVQKLGVLGNVLYLAAHPDDENTRFIAYCANERLYNTAYLSLTRGDGGQNLVGPELREQLGIIRTQELLAARRTDGGQQYFSRANDFGYSKTPEETLEIWDRDKILADAVRVIRQFQPDVIVCRFPADGGGGHGHHTASAVLGQEAFHLAADPFAYPEQLVDLETWQAMRIVVNTGRWWNPDISADEPGVVTEDVGAYSSVLGTSCTEIAARSRTMHKSQGFGSTGTRGETIEYFEHMDGEEANQSLFDGFKTDWSRVEGSSSIAQKVKTLIERFDIAHPEASLTLLGQVRKEMKRLKPSNWKDRKMTEVEQLMLDCAGVYLEAVAEDKWATPGDSVIINLECIARNSELITWSEYEISALGVKDSGTGELDQNKREEATIRTVLSSPLEHSQMYWLKEAGTLGTYMVREEKLIGTPENAPALEVTFSLIINNELLEIKRPLVYKWNDPVQGERYRPFVVVPPAFINFEQAAYLFTSDRAQDVRVTVKANIDGLQANLNMTELVGWNIEPRNIPLEFKSKGEEQTFTISVRPEASAKPISLSADILTAGESYDEALFEIEYEHIPAQVYMPATRTQLTYIDLKKKGERIGYISGAGDGTADALRNIGYQVDELTESDIRNSDLSVYDAIVTGIRLLNVDERIDFYMPQLLAYAEQGGTLVLQYNTRHRLKTDNFSPFPITLSRDRVTEEDAEVRFLAPDHSVLNSPNQITQADFENWVQERGLYFPSEWSEEYTPILSWNDTGEEPKDGSLLVAEYGKGHYVYSGISFFRELPAGVPGAYRLLVNILSLGND